MQLYALDSEKQLISARLASKHRNYLCLECQGIVRVRGGIHRQNHFFHLEPRISCHLSGKSMTHLQVQCLLQRLIPQGESKLEYRFPKINRIADVVWFNTKLIFEIQCSPISSSEVAERNRDYMSLGYQVVWVLHDQQFNQWKVSAAEIHLRNQPLYFTNMDADGNGIIYDQFDWIDQGRRISKRKSVAVNLDQPSMIKKERVSTFIEAVDMPRFIKNRLQKVPLYFEGDFVHAYFCGEPSLQDVFEEIREIEETHTVITEPKETFFKRLLNLGERYMIRPYLHVLQHLLERACQ